MPGVCRLAAESQGRNHTIFPWRFFHPCPSRPYRNWASRCGDIPVGLFSPRQSRYNGRENGSTFVLLPTPRTDLFHSARKRFRNCATTTLITALPANARGNNRRHTAIFWSLRCPLLPAFWLPVFLRLQWGTLLVLLNPLSPKLASFFIRNYLRWYSGSRAEGFRKGIIDEVIINLAAV